MDKKDRKIFSFSDPRQDKIHKRLREIGEGPAAFFKDACRMMEGDPPLESTSHLVAHCLREIESSIRDVMLPLDYVPDKKSGQTQKNEIVAILGSYGIKEDDEVAKLWLRIANKQEEIALHHLAHRNSLDRPRDTSTTFTELWTGMQDLLGVLLDKMEANYVGYIGTLDALLAKSKPEDKDIAILKNKIPHTPVTYNHFFGKLESPDWFDVLRSEGFFKLPPPAFDHPDGGVSYPFWSQGEYLKKMASITDKQKGVLEICLEIKTDNMRARNDILEISLLLPVDMTVQIVEKIDEIDYFLAPENYGKLIVYMSKNGKSAEATALARKVLAFVPDPRTPPVIDGDTWHYDPVTVIRNRDYEEIVEKNFPEFVDAAGIDALKVLFDQLDSFIELKNKGKKSVTGDDYSEIWRSAIEDHTQNHIYGVRDSLISSMRDASERFISNNPEKFEELISELETRKLSIYRRLKLHLLRKFPKNMEKKIVSELMDKQEFAERSILTHEYFLLAETHASLLSKEEAASLFEVIEKGGELDKEKFEEMCKSRGVEPTAEVAKKHKEVWQSYKLAPFKKVEPFNSLYGKLVSSVGKPENPDMRVRVGGSSWGFKSSISNEDFKKKKPDEIVEILKDFKSEEASELPLGKSREGTSRALVTEIAEDPSKWTTAIPKFSELDPTFARSILSAHREALKNNKSFDWKPLIDLGHEILKKPIEIKNRKPSGFFGDDPDWNWCRHTLVELIDDGMQSSHNKIPLELREDIWKIIETISHDPHPTPEEAVQLLDNNQDPLTAAINSTRGDAIGAAVQYGLWLKHYVDEPKQAGWTLGKDAPELKSLLEEKLEVSAEPFLGIRAVIGQRLSNLAWLDEEWVKSIIPKLFPDGDEHQIYFNAAWEAFIIFNQPYNGFLVLIPDQYARAIKELGQHSDNKHHLENPDEMVAHHLLQYYYWGKLELDKGLFKDFYEKASIEYKSAVISFIGRNFKKGEVPEPFTRRAVALAEHRLSEIKKSDKPHQAVQEFNEFSWWVSSEAFEEKWALDTLYEALSLGCDLEGDHLVVERFIELAHQYPMEVISCLELMVENDKKGWGVPTWGDDLSTVIRSVLASSNSDAKTKANNFIHRLVAKGHPQYKELLQGV